MALFKKQQTEKLNIEEKIAPFIKPKDGKKHVLMVASFERDIKESFKVEEQYTDQIDEVISFLQDKKYEIIGIEYTPMRQQTYYPNPNDVPFHTLITYK
ncbi:hypothetical protein R5Q19_05515 [Oenococcus oeni]|uniref:hypothetical protein n=1 Tax=Oenococcus oeni TaxID=1247 RepID=UPI00050DCDE1|nr:hypothetical protein [Oenococcus oeni]KGH73714.1 hypothetical protein X280_01965 [Oenococcus oeni IOEB_0502]